MVREATSKSFPNDWQEVIDTLTGNTSSFRIGIRAARFTEKIRLRTGDGPTFAELFSHLWPEHGSLPSPFPDGLTCGQRGEIREQFRSEVSALLSRSGWIRATAKTRSLRPGPRYRVPAVRAKAVPEHGSTSAD
jgi:hypothetical protein